MKSQCKLCGRPVQAKGLTRHQRTAVCEAAWIAGLEQIPLDVAESDDRIRAQRRAA